MRWPVIAILLVALAGAGCASTPVEPPPPLTTDPFAVVPMDFSIDLTILAGETMRDRDQVHLRQSRYVLFPDGSLHYGARDEPGAHWMPDLSRRLTRPQMAGVWSLARQIGYAEPANGDEPINLGTIRPEADEVAYLISFTGDNDRWQFCTRSSSTETDAAAVRLVHELARLAWSADASSASARPTPRRYDFGPDPYARYRQR